MKTIFENITKVIRVLSGIFAFCYCIFLGSLFEMDTVWLTIGALAAYFFFTMLGRIAMDFVEELHRETTLLQASGEKKSVEGMLGLNIDFNQEAEMPVHE